MAHARMPASIVILLSLQATPSMRRLALDLNGGANEIRTHDLCSAIAALSQLSYGPFRSHLVAGRDTCQGKRAQRMRGFEVRG